MANKQKLEILKSICIEHLSELVSKPYQIKAGDKLYEMATDGHRFLAFEVAKSSLPTVRSKTKKTPAMIVEWLTAKPTHTISDVAGFAGFLNLDGCAKCPMCAGTGKRTPESLHFGEMGFDDPIDRVRSVRISGFPLNANLLMQSMIFLEIGLVHSLPFRVDELKEKDGAAMFTFFGPGWILIQMGVAPEAEAVADKLLPEWSDFKIIAENEAQAV